MDMIDILVARALTPQGEIEQYAALAQQAVVNANNATTTANAAATTADAAAATAAEAATSLDDMIDQVEAALEDIQEATDTEIKKLVLSLTSNNISNGTGYNLVTTYPDNTTAIINNLYRLYNTTGNNTDGAMTQAAISGEITRLEALIDQGGGGGGSGGSTNLGPENAGKMVLVGDDGFIIPSSITEEDLINLLIKSGDYNPEDTIGLELDYQNRSFTRTQEAIGKAGGSDFNSYLMYGGRIRCNVSDDGTITAWDGDNNFASDGSRGQVMVYQPKFYYRRMPLVTSTNSMGGTSIRKDSVMLSDSQQPGFKIHPIFLDSNGNELDYVLLSAYEGSAYLTSSATYDILDSSTVDFSSDKLSSVANVKPISGVNKQFTVANAERMAQNRGSGWHITNLAAESLEQMLCMVEYGTPNGQNAIERGIVNINNSSSVNGSSLTGSTASLHSATGHADSTRNEVNGNYTDYTDAGRRAISYRGVENPWGNIWRMIGGLNVKGGGYGGLLYVCPDFNYSAESDNYIPLGFTLPSTSDWISAFAYTTAIDWAFIPNECSGANSALPIGDSLWTTANLATNNIAMAGGAWSFSDSCGLFYYAFDRGANEYGYRYSARLMFIPTINSIYNSNISKWRTKMGV